MHHGNYSKLSYWTVTSVAIYLDYDKDCKLLVAYQQFLLKLEFRALLFLNVTHYLLFMSMCIFTNDNYLDYIKTLSSIRQFCFSLHGVWYSAFPEDRVIILTYDLECNVLINHQCLMQVLASIKRKLNSEPLWFKLTMSGLMMQLLLSLPQETAVAILCCILWRSEIMDWEVQLSTKRQESRERPTFVQLCLKVKSLLATVRKARLIRMRLVPMATKRKVQFLVYHSKHLVY